MENSQKLGALFDKDTYAVPQKVTLLGILELKGSKIIKNWWPYSTKGSYTVPRKVTLVQFLVLKEQI